MTVGCSLAVGEGSHKCNKCARTVFVDDVFARASVVVDRVTTLACEHP